MQYGYYQFIRIAGCIGFSWLAYYEIQMKRALIGILLIGCAILFNPIIVIHLTRTIWNEIDLILAIGLIISALSEFAKRVLHGGNK